jgi:hypothetical protein
MKFSIVAALLLSYTLSFSQTSNFQDLLDTALNRNGCLFVHSKPLQVTRLDVREMRDYVENLRDWSKQTLDTAMFSQIIQNAKFADTTLWTDSELPNSLILHERGETVSKKYALQKLGPTNDEQVKFYKKQVNKFNSTGDLDRPLCYFSRPVFDNSKTFAVVQWDNGHSYLGGGGGMVLYQLQGDTWHEVGIIMNWRY